MTMTRACTALFALAFALLALTIPLDAAGTVTYDSANTVAETQSYTATLFVNGTAFPLTHTCAASAANVTCTAPLPNIAAALTPTGPQTFTVQFTDPVLGVTSPLSVPFLRNRPGAPTSPRLQ